MPEFSSDRRAIAGSHRTPLPGSERAEAVTPTERTTVTVMLRRPTGQAAPHVTAAPLTREQFAEQHGAAQADIDKVEAFAAANGLRVAAVDQAARTMKLTGDVAALQQAFGVQLYRYDHPGGSYRGREGEITVPADVAPVVVGVFGLDDRPQLHPHLRIRPEESATGLATAQAFDAPQVGKLYNFPANVDGSGQCIAIVEFGGGYHRSDLTSYFRSLSLTPPTVVSVSVDGGRNQPGTATRPNDADGEVALDIEVAGAIAPGARVAVYFAPNTDQGFVDAITSAVHDTANRPSVISISWGAPEGLWSQQTRKAMDDAFVDAAALGVTILAAAGDHGSADQPPLITSPSGGQTANPNYDGKAHVDFPASSPHAIGCGGTHLEGSGRSITGETVWNDGDGWATGGGVSDSFDVPTWQQNAGVPASVNPGGRVGRGVPDVAGNADSTTGYKIRLYGRTYVIGGTSAVAPLWAGLMALLNQGAGKPLGLITPQLYANGSSGIFNEVTSGTNAIAAMGGQVATAGYSADKNWDACPGLGSPNGAALLQLVTGTAAH
jgi:kumamolisin